MITAGSPVKQNETVAGAVIVFVKSVACMVIVTDALVLVHPPLVTILR